MPAPTTSKVPSIFRSSIEALEGRIAPAAVIFGKGSFEAPADSEAGLGGVGAVNASSAQASESTLQAFPQVVSMTPVDGSGPHAGSVSWLVRFSKGVEGVDAGDFALIAGATVRADRPVTVAPTSDPAVFQVTASGFVGNGALQLELVDNGTIHDAAGHPLIGNDLTFTENAWEANRLAMAATNLKLADVNGDGKMDVVAIADSKVVTYLNDGKGAFHQSAPGLWVVGAFEFALADLNGDGRLDVVVTYSSQSQVTIGLGGADGGFQDGGTVPLASYSLSVAVHDLDGDGVPDLAVAGSGGGGVEILRGHGDGTFDPAVAYAPGLSPRSVVVSDLNADGVPDLVATDFVGGTASLLTGAGDGTFQVKTIAEPDRPLAVASGDFNGDGLNDLVVTKHGGEVSVLMNKGVGNFSSTIYPSSFFGYSLAVGDMNGDGKLDFAVMKAWGDRYRTSNIGLFLGKGDGSFEPEKILATADQANAFGWADVTGDGLADFVVSAATLPAPRIEVLTASNDAHLTSEPVLIHQPIYVVAPGVTLPGKFAPPTLRVLDPTTGEELYHFDAYESRFRDSIRVAVGDMNGDGVDDIITTAAKGTGRLRVFNGLDGSRMAEGPFANEIGLFDGHKDRGAFVAVGDLNGDGYNDIVAGSALGGGKVRVLDGASGVAERFGAGESLYFQPFGKSFHGGVRVAIGDLNGDGRADLIAGEGYSGAKVRVYDGVAAETAQMAVTPRLDFTVGSHFRGGVSVAAGDVNGDGLADIIVGRNRGGASRVEIYSGRPSEEGAGSVSSIGAPIVPFGMSYQNGARVATVDANLDGIADILVAPGYGGNSEVQIYDGADPTHLLRSIVALPGFLESAVFVAGSQAPMVQLK